MIAIIDYGVGNLFSLSSSLRAIGFDAVVTGDAETIKKADKLILPGVGAFADAIAKLRSTGLDRQILSEVARGKKLLGICLGMQMLFDKSYEYGTHTGLGLIRGEVIPMEGSIDPGLKIPHIGWNSLDFQKETPLFKHIQDGDFVYFVHSYYADGCQSAVVATTQYGKPLTAAVAQGNVFGCQFHPEKSGDVGLKILKAFCEME